MTIPFIVAKAGLASKASAIAANLRPILAESIEAAGRQAVGDERVKVEDLGSGQVRVIISIDTDTAEKP